MSGIAAQVGRARHLPAGAPPLPVPSPLGGLFPHGGLARGSTVALAHSRSLLVALLAEVSAAGGWVAVVGMPELGGLAAAEAGVVLDRLLLVPEPGPQWPDVVAAMVDGVDLVALASPGGSGVPARAADRLAARARQRGSVLVPVGEWPRPDLRLTTADSVWRGLGQGWGRLRARELTVTATGRGAAARPRAVRVWLPDPRGRVAEVAVAARPTLTVVGGRAA